MRTAHQHNHALGSLIITHPFHPLKGSSFKILNTRKIKGNRYYSLEYSEGSFCVPENYTDRHLISQDHVSTHLSPQLLKELVDLISDLSITSSLA